MPKFKLGDRVETLDREDHGTVIEIVTYNDDAHSQKLRIKTDADYETLLAIELWKKTKCLA